MNNYSTICLLRNGHAGAITQHVFRLGPLHYPWVLSVVFKCFANIRITDQIAFLCVHAPRGHIYLRFLPPLLPSATKTRLCCTSSHTRKLFSPISQYSPRVPLRCSIPRKILLLIKCYTREIRKSFYSLQFDFLSLTQSLKLVSKFSVSVIESYALKSSGS